MDKVAEQHNRHIFKYAGQCKTCGANRFCEVCVYEDQRYIKDDGSCGLYIQKDDFEAQCARSLQYLDKHPELYEKILTQVSTNQ